MLQEVRFMARNVDYGSKGLIPFNCFKCYKNEKGRLLKEDVAYERIYCSVENVNHSRNNSNNVIRAVSFVGVFITTSPNSLEEDYYIENQHTGELWRIQTIVKTPINQGSFENNKRVQYEYRLECSR